MDILSLVKFQWYNGNIKDTTPRGLVSLNTFIDSHRNPTEKIMSVFDAIEKASSEGNVNLKKQLKSNHLFYFTPGALFDNGRKYTNIKSFTGLAQIDIDGLEKDEAIDLKEYLFETYKEFFCIYLSPSRRGVKGLIRIPIVKDVKEYKEYYQGIENELDWIAGFDSAPKNLALPLFISYDLDILSRNNAEVWSKKGDLLGENIENLSSKKPIVFNVEGDETVYKSKAYFKKISLDLFENKINSINDNGHPTLRGACLVLGSRCGAGYLSTGEALNAAQYLIKNNSYLSKGISNYIKTANWAINQGFSNPKYYD